MNFVLLRIVLFAAQEGLGDGQVIGWQWSVLAVTFLFHGVVFVWQVVGVLRASEHYIRSSGSMYPVWAAQLAIGVAAFWVISYSLEAWHLTQSPVNPIPSQAELRAEREAKYVLDLSRDGGTLTLHGTLELGVTARFTRELEANPNVTQIVLSSPGGNIYEARGLARLIRDHGLSTLVIDECSSACTTAFIGGARRELGAEGRLGFHQYRIDADYAVLNSDPVREQNRDRALFRDAGVAGWFLDRMFDSEAREMWFPERAELTEANVITENETPAR